MRTQARSICPWFSGRACYVSFFSAFLLRTATPAHAAAPTLAAPTDPANRITMDTQQLLAPLPLAGRDLLNRDGTTKVTVVERERPCGRPAEGKRHDTKGAFRGTEGKGYAGKVGTTGNAPCLPRLFQFQKSRPLP